jgi:hypothetical protein
MKKIFALLIIISAARQLSAQNVGIGTNIPGYPLTVISNSDSKGIVQKAGNVEVGFFANSVGAGFAVVRTWSPHDLSFATGNGNARMTIVHSTGFIGVGTVSPTGSFHVLTNGSTDATYSAARFEGSAFSSYFNLGANEATIINGGQATSPVSVNPYSTGGVYLSPTGGGVSIGSFTTPAGALDIALSGGYTARLAGTNYSSYFNFGANELTSINGGKPTSSVTINGSSTGGIYLGPKGGGVNIGSLAAPAGALGVTRSGDYTARLSGTNNTSYFNQGDDELTQINGGKATSAVTINSASTGGIYLSPSGGGVNIGSLAFPGGAFDVHRSGDYTTRLFGTNNASTFNSGSTETTIINGGKATSTVTINSSSSGNVFIATGGGNVGIGNITPLASLSVARGTGVNGTAEFRGTSFSSHFNYSTDETTFIRGGKATSMVVINDVSTGNVRLAEGGGNVGIGVAIPTAKLEVAGQVKITGGSPGAGKVLTSDANGLATWASKTASDAFKVFTTGNTALTFANNLGTILFSTAAPGAGNGSFDDGANFDNAANAYVAPKDGVYQFYATVSIEKGTSPGVGSIQLIPTASGYNLPTNSIRFNVGDQFPETISIGFITKMLAGNSISIKVSQTVGGTVTFAKFTSQFTGVRLY